MKILLVNGSPRINGCTNRALLEICNELNKYHIHTTIIWIGQNPLHCCNCRYCKKAGFCKNDDVVNELVDKIKSHDGIIFGSPVYYGGITSQLTAVLTRLFYSNPKILERKPVAGVFSSRRAGSTSAMSQFNLFFLMHNCNIIGSQYWNEVHGDFPNEVELDIEGLQTMRTLAKNMINALGYDTCEYEKKIHMNFISREYLKLLKNNKY